MVHFAVVVLVLIPLVGCCPKTAPAPSTLSRAEPDADWIRLDRSEARRKEVAALIDEAMAATAGQDRAAFALAAADRRAGDLADTIKAIDTARDAVLNNLKNLDTIGYKACYSRINGTDARISTNFEQGSLENTGRPLDVGIQGAGFIAVKTPDEIGGGVGYTRNGNFFVNKDGDLILGIGDGYHLTPPITIPKGTTDITIGLDGRVSVLTPGSSVKQNVGQILIHNFMNPHGLQLHGSSIYTETEASGTRQRFAPGDGGTGQLLQGFLEASNVDLNRERVRLRFLLDWKAVLMKAVDRAPTN